MRLTGCAGCSTIMLFSWCFGPEMLATSRASRLCLAIESLIVQEFQLISSQLYSVFTWKYQTQDPDLTIGPNMTTGHGFECFQTWLPKNWRVGLWLVRQPYQRRTSLMTIVGKKPNPTNMMLWLCEILFSFIPCPIRVATLGREVTTFFKKKSIAGGRNLAVAPVDM